MDAPPRTEPPTNVDLPRGSTLPTLSPLSPLPPSVGPEGTARILALMSEPARTLIVTGLRRRQLAALFELGADNPPPVLEDLVPAAVPPLTEVIHEGKNSLPAFTRFQKRFCRPPHENPVELWGYNEQRMRAFTGPGYFVVHTDDGGDLVIDYRRLPPEKPPAWPPILPNSARLSRFVYHDMVDVLRTVAPSVTVGRAFRRGRPLDAWFALVRS